MNPHHWPPPTCSRRVIGEYECAYCGIDLFKSRGEHSAACKYHPDNERTAPYGA